MNTQATIEAPKAVLRDVDATLRRFDMITPGSRVAVGVSGGKDSLLLAVTLRALGARADWDFEVVPVHLDQRQPGFDRAGFDAALAACGLEPVVVEKDTWSVVSAQLEPGAIPCPLCSRMRRGILNRWCEAEGIETLALGHHLDDAVETFFLNLFFQRQLEPLKPVTPNASESVRTVRPMIRIEAQRVRDWVARSGLEPVPCPVCDGVPSSQRRRMGALLHTLREAHPELALSVRDALYR